MPLAAGIGRFAREVSGRNLVPVQARGSCLDQGVVILRSPGRTSRTIARCGSRRDGVPVGMLTSLVDLRHVDHEEGE